jgi:O-antigen/teichoic acid export membrane protein
MLKQLAFSAVRWTALATVYRAGLQILQVAILTRLLAPDSFGLMAIITAILSVATIFSDMGISSAIIQRQTISLEQLSSLYWLNVIAGLALMATLMLASPVIANFYGDSRLTWLVGITSSIFFINSLSQQLRVRSEKNIQFAKVARIDMAAAGVGFLSAVGLAYSGLGVYSLAWAAVISALFSTILAWLMLSNGWYPKLHFSFVEIREFLNFGTYMVGNNIASNLNMMADVFFGGKLLGVAALGLYSLPRNFCLQIQGSINPIITRVGFTVMSKVQDDPNHLKLIFLKALRMTASVNFPIYVGVMAFAPEIVALLFGEKWLGSVDSLRILAVWGMVRSTKNPVGILLLATGRAKQSFRWNLSWLVIHPATIWIGAQWGIEGIASALLISSIIGWVPSWYILVRPCCQASLMENIWQLVAPLWICLVATFAGYISAYGITSGFFRMLVGLGISTILYIVLSYFFNREWTSSILQLLNRKGSSPLRVPTQK